MSGNRGDKTKGRRAGHRSFSGPIALAEVLKVCPTPDDTGGGMNDCCMNSFIAQALQDKFRIASEGEEHQCDDCGRVYVMKYSEKEGHPVWTLREPLTGAP